MIWLRRIGKAAVIVAYVVSEPGRAVRSALDVWRAFRREDV